MQAYEKTKKLSLAIPIVLLVLALALAGTAAKGIGGICAILSLVTFFYRCSQKWVGHGDEYPETARTMNDKDGWGEAEFLDEHRFSTSSSDEMGCRYHINDLGIDFLPVDKK